MNIQDVFSNIISTYNDWHKYIINPNFTRSNNEITWQDCAPMFLPENLRLADVQNIIDQRQYTYQVGIDNSIFQIRYQFSRTNLISACLAFYSSRNLYSRNLVTDSTSTGEDLIDDTDDIPSQNEVEFFRDDSLILEDAIASWIRIDYTPRDAKGILHHDCHLHMSTFPNSRFIVNRIPTPKQFVEFVMSIMYPDFYKLHRLNDNGHFRETNSAREINQGCEYISNNEYIYKIISFFHIPTTY